MLVEDVCLLLGVYARDAVQVGDLGEGLAMACLVLGVVDVSANTYGQKVLTHDFIRCQLM